MELRIIAETPQEKGKSFERLMGMVLDKLGYTDVHYDIHATGIEIDVKAKHKVTNNLLICECKAHEQSIASADLTSFYGKFHIEKGRNPASQGYFFSTSGFNGTATEWYEQNIPSEDKPQFKIFNNDQIIALLIKSGLLIEDKDLESRIKSQINHPLDERYVAVFESRLYVVQIFKISDSEKRFVVYAGDGSLASRNTHEQLSKLDSKLTSIPLVNLEILDKVLINLLDLKQKTISEISAEVVETENDVKTIIGDLKAENLLNIDSSSGVEKFSLKQDITTLTNLTKRFTESKHKLSFMSSEYVNTLIDEKFVSEISSRFMIEFDDMQKTVIGRAASIFPSVLSFLLLSNPDQYVNVKKQMEQLGIKSAKQDEDIFTHFMGNILENILTDLRSISSKYLDDKGVAGFSKKIDFKIASEYELIFAAHAGGVHGIFTAGGAIKIGELVSATDISLFQRRGNLLMALELYDKAIIDFDLVISNVADKELLKAAYTNKGLCYLRQHKPVDAETCFDKALEIEPNLIQALTNKALCRQELGDEEGAKKLDEHIKSLNKK